MEKIKNRLEFLQVEIIRLSKEILNTETFDNTYFENIKKLSKLRIERDSLFEAMRHGK